MNSDIKLLSSALITILFWIIVIVYSFFGAIPHTPIKLPFVETLNTQIITPQGWSFFSRDPREEEISLYYKNSAGIWTEMIPNNSDVSNWFGLKRSSRAKGVEYGRLLSKLDREVFWKQYEGSLENCFSSVVDTLKVFHAGNDMPNASLCGELLFVKSEPIPWAWRNSDDVEMPKQLLKLNVSCK